MNYYYISRKAIDHTLSTLSISKVPIKWNFCPLSYSRKLKSMMHCCSLWQYFKPDLMTWAVVVLQIPHKCYNIKFQPNACSGCFEQYFTFLLVIYIILLYPSPALIILLNPLPVLVALKTLQEILSFTHSLMMTTEKPPMYGSLKKNVGEVVGRELQGKLLFWVPVNILFYRHHHHCYHLWATHSPMFSHYSINL